MDGKWEAPLVSKFFEIFSVKQVLTSYFYFRESEMRRRIWMRRMETANDQESSLQRKMEGSDDRQSELQSKNTLFWSF